MIRVTPRTNAAINIVVGKLKAANPTKKIRQDDAIWYLIEQSQRDVAEMVTEAAEQPEEHDNE